MKRFWKSFNNKAQNMEGGEAGMDVDSCVTWLCKISSSSFFL